MGVISSVGNDVDTFWTSLKNGVCGIDYIDEFDTGELPVKIAGKVKNFNPEDYGMESPSSASRTDSPSMGWLLHGRR